MSSRQSLAVDTIDTRFVFRIYAFTAGALGILVFLWGPRWLTFGVDASANAGLMPVRVNGAIVFAAGLCAYAMSLIDDPLSHRRGLFWWSAAHFAVFFAVAIQVASRSGRPDPADYMALVALLTVAVIFAVLRLMEEGMPFGVIGRLGPYPEHTSIFGDRSRGIPIARLRSEYEEKIRDAARQEERNRLARDLHDSIKQQIFVIQTAAATAQARFGSDPSGASQAIDQVRTSAREAMRDMEVMLDQLRTAPLENTSLVDALKRQCEALQSRTGADVQFGLGELPTARLVLPGTHQALFRVAQEAMANIGRHARASIVGVRLDSSGKNLTLEIEDDGVGFDVAQPSRGMGLENMRARLAPLGGTVTLTSRPGAGTLVRASVPCLEDEYADLAFYRRRVYIAGGIALVQALFTARAMNYASRSGDLISIVRVAFTAMFLLYFGLVLQKYRRIKRQGEQS